MCRRATEQRSHDAGLFRLDVDRLGRGAFRVGERVAGEQHLGILAGARTQREGPLEEVAEEERHLAREEAEANARRAKEAFEFFSESNLFFQF